MTIKAQTGAQRIGKMRDEAARRGWKRRDYYATPDEHGRIRKYLERIRKKGG